MSNRKLWTIAAVEGMAIMAVEVLGGKMLAPYFGSSLYIWSSVIGITLLCLTSGYFIGAHLSKKTDLLKRLYLLLNIAAVGMIAMPVLAEWFFQKLNTVNIFINCIAMSMLILSVPLIALGATSPLLIQYYTRSVAASGETAGRIYAVSTTGALINTFILGFFLIPEFGVRIPLLINSLLVFATANFFVERKKVVAITSAVLIVILCYLSFRPAAKTKEKYFNLVYHSEGIMGQLKVLDYIGTEGYIIRALMSNSSPQSIIARTNVTAISQYNYVHFISTFSTLKPAGSSVLLLGMAAGSLVHELQNQGFKVDVVDIDERMFEIAEKYFYFHKNNSTNLFADDARHFIKTAQKKYDIVIIDISAAEIQPSYLYTLESFTEIKNLLTKNGLFFINFLGTVTGNSKLAKATVSVQHTLKAAGFHSYFYAFTKGREDIQFISSPVPVDFTKLDQDRINLCCLENIHIKGLIKKQQFDSTMTINTKPLILKDNFPKLERLKYDGVIETRKQLIKWMEDNKLKKEIDLFK